VAQLLGLWTGLDQTRRIAAAALLIVSLLGLGTMLRAAFQPGYALLYAGLEDAMAGEVMLALDARNIPYQVRGDSIHVPAPLRDETRLMLAASGLPANAHAGYELLDSLSGFGTTAQMFDAAYWRAKEGELARTIVASPHVRAARVHIAQTTAQPFRRDTPPSAAVTVTTTSGMLNASQAQAIRHLVASSVAGMLPDQVAVIDGAGGLVYGPEGDGQISTPNDRAADLRRRVERLLEAHVGHGRAVVEVSLDLNTDREVIHERRVDPDSRVAIATETEESTAQNSDNGAQQVTVASNLPDGDAGQPGPRSESRENQTRARTNFDMSETRREIERLPGATRRLSVAVLIDGVRTPGTDGTLVWRPRTDPELETLRDLVASAVGFDAERGDVITLRSLEFEPVAALGTEARTGWLQGAALDATALLRWMLLLVAIVVFALMVVRPLLRAMRTDQTARLPALDEPVTPVLLNSSNTVLPAQGRRDMDTIPEDPVERLRGLIATRGPESVELLRHLINDNGPAKSPSRKDS
jgi:flagellar M-ring protein FliF